MDRIDDQDYLTIFNMVNYMWSALLHLVDNCYLKPLTSQVTGRPTGCLDPKPEFPQPLSYIPSGRTVRLFHTQKCRP